MAVQAFSKVQNMITYKAKAVGIKIDTEDEAYTSQTCPSCGHRKKPHKRKYHCQACKWQGHRDVIGASNILTKYQGWLFNRVVGAMVFPQVFGIILTCVDLKKTGHPLRDSNQVSLPRGSKEAHTFRRCEYHGM